MNIRAYAKLGTFCPSPLNDLLRSKLWVGKSLGFAWLKVYPRDLMKPRMMMMGRTATFRTAKILLRMIPPLLEVI